MGGRAAHKKGGAQGGGEAAVPTAAARPLLLCLLDSTGGWACGEKTVERTRKEGANAKGSAEGKEQGRKGLVSKAGYALLHGMAWHMTDNSTTATAESIQCGTSEVADACG